MKIAHVATTGIPVVHPRGGAVQRRILGVAREQARLGHEVIVFSPGQESPLDLDGVSIVPVPFRTPRPYRDYEYLFQVRRKLRTEHVDVIHAHGSPDAGRVLGKDSCSVRVLTVDYFKYRLSKNRLGRRYYRESLMAYDRVLPVSNFCQSNLQEYYSLPSALTQVVYNGVDLEHFYPDAREADRVRKVYSLKQPYLLYLGRVNRQKGSDMLPRLAEALPHMQVVAAGPLGQFGAANQGYDNPLASSKVRYLGAIPDSDLRGILSGATLLILPTRHDEMFGMVVVEAGACGTPTVASSLGGIPESMGSGGILFEAGSTDAMIAKVRSLLADPQRIETLGSEARQNAQRFAWPVIADQYLHYYTHSRTS